MKHRYGKRLRTYRRAAWWWGQVGLLIGIAIALLGVAGGVSGALGKGVGKGSAWSIVAIAVGAFVTALTGLNRTWKPEEKSVHYHFARGQLRREGWDYVQQLGAYKKTLDADGAYAAFAQRIEDILALQSGVPRTRSRR